MKKTEKPEVSFKIEDKEYLRLDDLTESNLDSVIRNLSEYMENNTGKGGIPISNRYYNVETL